MNWWNKISNIGVAPEMESGEVRRIHLLNRMVFFSICITTFYIPFFLFLHGYSYIPFQIAATILLLTPFYLIKKGFIDSAAVTLLSIISMNLIGSCLYVQDMGAELFFIPVALGPFSVIKGIRLSFVIFVGAIAAYILCVYLQFKIDDLLIIPDELKPGILFTNVGGVFAISFLLIYHFRLTSEKHEKKLEFQKELIAERNQEILDSINYAKRIQFAILPPDGVVKEQLPDSFILYKPKDVVAGDFYWFESVDFGSAQSTTLIAAADCTGHGVPGAMVSVVCNNALNRAVREYGLSDPGKILDKTREIVIQEFEKSEDEVKDGMDIALVSLQQSSTLSADPQDPSSVLLKYSGANNPLWIIRKNSEELEEIKANKQPIGKFHEAAPFHTHEIELSKGDIIYLFTDGFADQFGGDKGKKFKSSNFKNLLLSIQNESMDRQKVLIDKAFEDWRGELEQIDDVCIIGVKV